MSSFDSLVSGGTQGKVSLRRPNALLSTLLDQENFFSLCIYLRAESMVFEKKSHLIRMRSLALAAPLGTRSLSLIASSSSFFRRGIVGLIVSLLDLFRM